MSNDWWEKTVEYAFVVSAFNAGKCDIASPLAGKHERLGGDAVFAKASSYVLIEFKRSESETPTEESLFSDYDDAKSRLQRYRHHHLVFGVASDNEQERLKLAAKPYFGGTKYSSALDCLDTGVPEIDFRAYLDLLSQLKREDGRGSGGHVSPEALSTVLGISNDGRIVSAQSLYEHSPVLFPVDVSRLDHTPKPSSGWGPR